MQNASFQLSQLIGDGSVLTGKKTTKAAGIGDVLLGNNDQFKSLLLGGLAKSRQARLLAGDTLNVAAAKKTATDPSALLSQIQLSPELLSTLKNLTTEDLASLPADLASVFAPHMVDGKLDDNIQGLLGTLSALVSNGNANLSDLYKIINDPKLATFLAGFAGALHALQNPALTTVTLPVSNDSDDKSFGQLVLSTPVVTAASVSKSGDSVTLVTDKGTITVNVVDMNAEQFNAFKKLAFADIAPFLTQPRTVRIDANTVMKVSQGPSFLSDDTSLSTLVRSIDLASFVPANAVKASDELTDAAAVVAETPIFLNADVLKTAAAAMSASAETASGAQTTTIAAGVVVRSHDTGRANFFAALLGVPVQTAATAQTAAAPATNIQQKNADALAAATLVATQNAPASTAATSNAPIGMPQQLAAMLAAQTTGHRAVGTSVLKGLDTTLASMDDFGDTFTSIDTALPIHAESASASNSASALLAAKSATAQHPASYMVSIALQRGIDNAVAGADRQFTIQLDPENLGRVKITLEFGENNKLTAKLVAERPETVALLQKDAGALERTLQNSGFDVKPDSLTFNLGDNGSFSGSMSQNGNSYQNGGNQASDDDGTDIATIHTVMPIFVDPVTGLTHVNIIV